MSTPSQLHPTINEETVGGAGSTSFGSFKFAPKFISGFSGDFTAWGSYQVLSRIVFFQVYMEGTITVAASAAMYDPITAAKFPVGHASAGKVITRGMGHIEYNTAGPNLTFQLETGGWPVGAGTFDWIKITGWYWVE